jgi:hypothetical protein
MTTHQFRRTALSLPGVEERAHMRHTDFRVGGKVFATLGYPDKQWGMVRLTPEEQRNLVPAQPGVFVPAPGAWGTQGCTLVRLKVAEMGIVRDALFSAWQARAPKGVTKQTRVQDGSKPAHSKRL